MSIEVAALQLLLTPGLGSKTFARLLEGARAMGVALNDVVLFSPQDLIDQMGLRPAIAEGVPAARREAERTYNAMMERGIRILVRSHRGYPHRLIESLGEDAPPVLYVSGKASLLDCASIAIGGSRSTSEDGLLLSERLSRGLVRAGINIVSGNAAGVDTAAHFGAIDAGGTSTFVLAEGILGFKPKSSVGESLSEVNHVVVSEFAPGTRWAAHYAMQRNRTILGLSAGFVAVEPGVDGGTFDAATNAQRLGLPLYVLEHEGVSAELRGTKHFLSRGALSISPGPQGDFDVSRLVAVARKPNEPPQTADSGLLFPGAVKRPKRKPA